MKTPDFDSQLLKAAKRQMSERKDRMLKTFVVEIGTEFSDLRQVCYRGTTQYLRSCSQSDQKSTFLTQTEEGRGAFLKSIEKVLISLSEHGQLRTSVFYLGYKSDPFIPFNGKFDATVKFLELFGRYMPGKLFIKTRSPVLVCALPALQALGQHVSVVVPIETCSKKSAQRYTPKLPGPLERLKMARVLKNFGIEVVARVSPVLPYGSWKRDAKKFAELLSEHADYIQVYPLSDGSLNAEKRLRSTELVTKLAEDSKYEWLRPDAAEPLKSALKIVAPEKLKEPPKQAIVGGQIDLFAA